MCGSQQRTHSFAQWVSYVLKSFLLIALKVSYVYVRVNCLQDVRLLCYLQE